MTSQPSPSHPTSSRPVAVIAGASGFVGAALVQAFAEDGYEVRTIGRSHADATWDDGGGIRALVDGASVLVNLAGKSVNCRYTDANRDEILRSRVETTRTLRQAVTDAATPPRVWLNASTATIYRYAMDRPQTEADGELGDGFSVDVARNWEDEFFAGDLPATRRVALRMAIVIGDGPASHMLLRLARLGLGGPQHDGWWWAHRRYRGIGPHPTGNGRPSRHRSGGRQRFSWIHIDDVVGAVRVVRDRPEIEGPVNLVAPRASDNRTLMATLRRVVGQPIGLPAYRFMLEPAMAVLRTEPELVLKSRWVSPEVLLSAGYDFAYPDLEAALRTVAR
ncbi:epimerase [Microbacterium sp. NPDC056569]|uniref:epimerase n=1 Tax=Microbacterium sp. NPDC056569 TaxID=3345867 RepID=UPI003672E0DE